jgi:lysozyme
MVDPSYLNAIKQFEGYSAETRWDYAQNTNGYGTRARFAGEVIDKPEADRRFSDEIKKASDFVSKFAPDLDDGSKAALTSLTYNTGTAWTQSGLGQAVASGDLDKAKSLFLQYNKAGGAVVDGLVQRRLQEVAWFGQGLGAGGPTTQIANASLAAMASAASGAASSGSLPDAPRGAMFLSTGRMGTGSSASSGGDGATPFSSLNSDQILLSLLSHMANAGVGNDDKNTRKSENRSDQKSPEPDVLVKTG